MKRMFLTTKVVQAEEMTRKEYCNLRNWDLPQNENPDEKVFKVTYSDGYISTCPKDRFLEQAYELTVDGRLNDEIVRDFIVEKEFSTEKVCGKLNTVLRYKLANGFTGIESTTAVYESNYSRVQGEQILLKGLMDKIYFGLGFAMAMSNKYKEGK